MDTPVIARALRTPFGALHGALSAWHPVDLLAEVLRGLVPSVEELVSARAELLVGCVEQVGGQGGNVAAGAALAAGWPAAVSGTTVDRDVTSGVQALAFAAASIRTGERAAAVAAAVDVPSLVPAGAAAMGRYPYGRPWGEAGRNGPRVPPGVVAERLAAADNIGRTAQDEWAARSVLAAQRAKAQQPAPGLGVHSIDTLSSDELVASRTTSVDELGVAPPLFDPEGTITAGNSAPPADAAAAVLVQSSATAARGTDAGEPLAEVLAVRLRAGPPDDPRATIRDLTHEALDAAAVSLEDVVRVELFEPYAAVALAVLDAVGLEARLVNPDGGALAIGAPTATGPLAGTVTLAHALARQPAAVGLQLVPGPGPVAVLVLRGAPYAGAQ